MTIEYFEKIEERPAMKGMALEKPLAVLEWDEKTTPQARLTTSCFQLISGVLEICWELDIEKLTATIKLKLFGETIGTWHIDKDQTCVHIGVDAKIAKATLDFCVNWDKNEVTLKGEACYWKVYKWECAKFDVVLFHW